MVAQTIELPNLRKIFIPGKNHVIIDADLQRADAQVVAWDADDEELKNIFRSGLDIHSENAKAIGCTRQQAKQGVHAVNYGVSARTLSTYLNCTTHQAQQFIDRWLDAHPKIKTWQRRIRDELETTRTIRNKFGFRRFFFDRVTDAYGKTNPKTFHEALSFIPQSTVAIVTNKGLLNIDNNLPQVELLLQVHDSLVMQTHRDNYPEILNLIIQEMSIPIPYDDPLIIPVTTAVSFKSWGDVKSHRQLNGKWEVEVADKDWRILDIEGNGQYQVYR